MSDEQDVAESVDEEMVGTDGVTSDEVGAFDDAPERPVGLPFADADVTDESMAERAAREVPEDDVPYDVDSTPLTGLDVVVDSNLMEQIDQDGDFAEPD